MSETTPRVEMQPSSARGTTPRLDGFSFLAVFSCVLIVLIFGIIGAALYLEPTLLDQLKLSVGLGTPKKQESTPRPQGNDTRFAALYQRFEMPPLKASLTRKPAVAQALTRFAEVPCDNEATNRALIALGPATREAANILRGVGKLCPVGIVATGAAAEIFFTLGDFGQAIELSTAVLQEKPDSHQAFHLRARANQADKRYEQALNDYVALFALVNHLKLVPSEIFMRMSSVYEALDRPCEAMTPIRNYIAVEPANRMTAELKKRLSDLEAKGKCPPSTSSNAKVFVPRRSDGMIVATVFVNGVSGRFLIDTGATYVTVTKRHADKVRLKTDYATRVRVHTANGLMNAQLVSAGRVRLGTVSALAVETIVADKDFGMGLDGLLGMSFLSRFGKATLGPRGIEISAAP